MFVVDSNDPSLGETLLEDIKKFRENESAKININNEVYWNGLVL